MKKIIGTLIAIAIILFCIFLAVQLETYPILIFAGIVIFITIGYNLRGE